MSWTTPTIRFTGDLVTANIWNTDVVNNLKWGLGADGRSTSFPGSPVDGQVFDYVADATNGVIWRFKYNSGEATYKWQFVGGPPMFAEVATSQNMSSATYGGLATAGPSITVARAGDYFVEIGSHPSFDAGNTGDCYHSYDIGGTGAVDADAIHARMSSGGTVADTSGARPRLKAGLAASTALVSKYRVPGAVAVSWENRWMRVLPVRVI